MYINILLLVFGTVDKGEKYSEIVIEIAPHGSDFPILQQQMFMSDTFRQCSSNDEFEI